ncbi:nucleoside triphosphate pyrophosphohydrolase [Shewanella sp. NIFS-20-20]|uniref:nucleoside triphosphate pyrophosphohydrolase n=1 Tax=Shewanella sp. NIFS-20-20 TaxID=2853806 RepID=UPI001C453FC1|nr:nucleoside triphosphate pyrophosphohydrolase [Shewanella sp. NIFS-20-20]
MTESQNIQRLLAIMSKLRNPDGGCAWDQAQTYQSLVPFTLEEAYEVADAIERLALEELPDELGDLLYQVVFYCQLGKEQGLFDFAVVTERICNKLIRRHPHVFAETLAASSADSAKLQWEQIKGLEREKKALHSQLDDIPKVLPALKRAQKIQQRVAVVGFDWPELAPVIDKIHEEIAEVLAEVNAQKVEQAKVQDEVGDLLFAVVNLARHLNIDPELALQGANTKFERRFRLVEQQVQQTERSIEQHSLDELEQYWQQAKRQLSSQQ